MPDFKGDTLHTHPEETTHMTHRQATPTAQELMDAIGYGKRPPVEIPTASPYHLTARNHALMDDTPILRRLRPLVMMAKKGGVRIHDLSVGCLDVLPPDRIYEAIVADSRHPEKYAQSYGEDVLLDEMATYIARMTGVSIERHHSMVVDGGIGAVRAAIELCTEVGDLVVVINPNWPNTSVIAKQLNRKVKAFTTSPDDGWHLPSASDLKKLIPKATKLLVIERPGNPHAANWTEDEMLALADLVTDPDYRDLVIFADEEYWELCTGMPRSLLELGLSRIVSGQGFSKCLALTSARLGRFTTLDRGLLKLLIPYCNVRLCNNNFMNLQHAIAALLNDFGPTGLTAYFYHLNRRINGSRAVVRQVMEGYDPLQLISGQGAYYDVLVSRAPHFDGVQTLLWRLVKCIEAARNGKGNGELPEFTYCIPMSGFYLPDAKKGEESPYLGTPPRKTDGFRLTLSITGDPLARSQVTLRNMVDDHLGAGAPYIGTIEEVIGKVKANQPVTPIERPTA